MHAEAASNITNLAELLSLLFQLSAFLVYVAVAMSSHTSGPARVTALAWTCVCIAAAMLCKETGVMVASVLVAMEIFRSGAIPFFARILFPSFLLEVQDRSSSSNESWSSATASSRSLRNRGKASSSSSGKISFFALFVTCHSLSRIPLRPGVLDLF
jgi:hypothetical protein